MPNSSNWCRRVCRIRRFRRRRLREAANAHAASFAGGSNVMDAQTISASMARSCLIGCLVAWLGAVAGCSGEDDFRSGDSRRESVAAPAPNPMRTTRGAAKADDEWPPYQWSEALPLYRWSEAGGTERLGVIPMDPAGCGPSSAIGRSGIALWRHRTEGGDDYICEPWLFRPGSQGQSLGKAGVYRYTNMDWLPGKELLAMNVGRGIRLFDSAGQFVREFSASGDPGLVPVALEVNPGNGRIAVLLLASEVTDEGREGSDAGAYALAILGPEGTALAKMDNVGAAKFGDGFLDPPRMHWLPDNRIAFLDWARRRGGRDDEAMGALVVVAPGKGTVTETGIHAYEIAGVHPSGLILFDDGRYYDPHSGKLDTLSPGEEWYPSNVGFSADGRRFVAWKWLKGGGQTVSIIDWSPRRWRELGSVIPLGWAPDGSLYFVPERKPE